MGFLGAGPDRASDGDRLLAPRDGLRAAPEQREGPGVAG
ncbi:MAG: hypothetical protein K0S88_6641, partial [Actinomycetia bacterium]|nr:hypothetical protein [Actinomycetes bacterium]